MRSAWHRLRVCLIAALVLGSVSLPVQRTYASLPGHATPAALAQVADNARVSVHRGTGKVRFVGTEPARAMGQSLSASNTLTPEQAARGFLTDYGPSFGLTDQAQELSVRRQTAAGRGRTFVKFQQEHSGIPVFGGELIVQVNGNNNVVSANGEILPDIDLAVTPQIRSPQAAQTAREVVAKLHEVDAESLIVSEPELWIYDPVLVGPDSGPTQLVWRTEVSSANLLPIRELVLVDTQRGSVALHFNQVHTFRNRETYDAQNGSSLPGTPVCDEGNSTCAGIADAVAAHLYAGHTYDFYLTHHSRDSVNGAGLTLISTVRYCPTVFSCPYANAFWNGVQMVYGAGFSAADDVVAHELTHGVTQYESGLYYYYQSGAINESFSDLWGEFVDLTNGTGDDSASVRWLLGEDIPGNGAIRNMKNPSAAPFYDPDRMTSDRYVTSATDSGGVHSNSGINNKAIYLMTDGGTFNGYTVSPLGIDKVADIYYEVQTKMLTSGSDYADLYDMLYQACLNLVGSGGIIPADCNEVRDATNAVEMDQQPLAGFNPDAPLCPAGEEASHLFFDDFEAGSGSWTFGALAGANRWGHDGSPNGHFAHSGISYLYADDYPAAVSDSYADMGSSISLPANAYLHFAHAYAFEGPDWDGGVVEYSINNGGTWQDAESLFDFNGYDGTIRPSISNPLGGREGFLDDSHGYISSRLDLASLSGQSVRFRWRMGLDEAAYDWGWWLDDVQIYTCGPVLDNPPSADAGGPYSGNEGASIILDGSGSTDAGGSIVAYGWDLDNDGQYDNGSGVTITKIYADNGVYGVGLQVTDNDGYTDTVSTTVSVSNVAPVVAAGEDQTVGVGQSVSLAPAGFSDVGVTDTHTATIQWGDGSLLAPGALSESSGSGTVDGSHSYSSAGTYTVEVCVTDDDGDRGCDSLSVTVNSPPSADAGGPYSGNEGASIILDGSGSTDAGGSIVAYGWDLDNDGQYDNGSGVTTTKIYADNGVYSVGLQVTDNDGYTDTVSTSVSVSNVAPVVAAGEDQTVGVGQSVSLEPAGFSDVGVTDTHTATIQWGDGSPLAPGSVSESSGSGTVDGSHSYSSAGTYTVEVCVTDDDGDRGCDSLSVVVNSPPSADAGGPYRADKGSTITLDGSGSTDVDGTIVSYKWDLDNDGLYDTTGVTTTVTYTEFGAYAVALEVSDDGGGSDSTTVIVTVAPNVAPSADAGGPYSGNEGASIILDGSGSTDAGGSIVAYGWDLDNDGQYDNGSGVSTTKIYADNGVYSVGLQVTDNDGYTDTVSTTVSVSNVAPVVAAGEDQTVGVGQSVSLAPAGFSDVGVTDTHTATIQWGDGSLLAPGALSESSGSGTADGSHSYSSAGIYTVEVCVTDDDGAEGCDSLAVVVEASSTPIAINAYLALDGQVASHNPVPVANAPAGVFTIEATFSNISAAAISDPFFELTTLIGEGDITFLNAKIGSSGTDVIVSVPAALLGENRVINPGETLMVDFEVGLAGWQGFAFVVDAYGSVPGNASNNDGAGFRFDVEEAQLREAENVVYLPIIGR